MGHAERKRDPDKGWDGHSELQRDPEDKGWMDMQSGFPMRIAFSTESKHKDMWTQAREKHRYYERGKEQICHQLPKESYSEHSSWRPLSFICTAWSMSSFENQPLKTDIS